MSLNNQYLSHTHPLTHIHTPWEESLLSGNIRSSRYTWMAIGARLTHSEGTQDQCFRLQAKFILLLCVCVCRSVCILGVFACPTSCLLIHGILILRWWWWGSEDRPSAPGQAECVHGLAWQERPLVELPHWAPETKTSACVSKHGPLSPPRGQELRII